MSKKPSYIWQYVERIIQWRWLVLFLSVFTAIGVGTGVQHITLGTDYRIFFGLNNPDLLAFNELEATYTKNDSVVYVIRVREGDIFTQTGLQAIAEITKQAWKTPHSTRVDSVTNYQHTWANEDNLIVEDLVKSDEIDDEAIARAKRIALKEPLLLGRLISSNAKTAGVNVRIQLPGRSLEELPAVAKYSRSLRDSMQSQYPELEIHITGISMLSNAFAETPKVDMPVVMPLMFGILLLTMIFFLRSFLAAIATFILVSFSAVAALGLAGYLGTRFDPASVSAPIIILTLAVADAMHVLVSFFGILRKGFSKEEAICKSFQINARSIFLTSITTAVGFLSLNFSDSPPFRILGNVTAVGVMIAWAYSMTFLPAILSILPLKATKEYAVLRCFVSWCSEFVIQRHKQIALYLNGASLLLIALVPTLQVNDRYHEYFSPSMEFRKATDFALEHLIGPYFTSYSLKAGDTNSVSSPEFLKKVDRFAKWLRQKDGVVHVNSFSDVMKRLNMNMNGDDPSFYRIPETRQLGAQYIFLYEISLPYGLDINDQIDIDKSSLRLDITFANVDIQYLEQIVLEANEWLNQHGTETMKGNRSAGTGIMFANITRRNIQAMITGTAIGFGLIALILSIALGSVKIGAISLVPNILPSLMAFGIWSLFYGEVGFAISVVAGLSIGIIVDDTVHFLAKYWRGRKELGKNSEDSVRYAFETVGSAILGTTIIVAAGFAVLGLSMFRVTSYMGLLTSLAIVCAFITDFFLLPSLLILFDRKKLKKKRIYETVSTSSFICKD